MKTTHKTPLSKLSQVTSFIKNAGILWQILLPAFGKQIKIYSHYNLQAKIKNSLLKSAVVASLLLLGQANILAGTVYSTIAGSAPGVDQYADYGSYSWSPGRHYYYFNGSPVYQLAYNYNNNGNNRWEIWNISSNTLLYYSNAQTILPPQNYWNQYSGASPVPVLSGTSTDPGYCTTPGAPLGVYGTPTNNTTATLHWSAGTAGSINITYYWVVGTSSSVTWGSGVAQSTSTGTSYNLTGLTANTTYYLRVYAYTNCDGTTSAYTTSAPFTTYTDPTITSFTPTSTGTGTVVTITGTNFTGATAVSFGTTAASSFNVASATSITALVASGTSGNVSVTTPGGTAVRAGFTFIPAPTISSFTPTSAAQGTTVTIAGTNLTGATAVSFGGTAATSINVVSATSITAVVQSGATGTVSVTTPGGTGTSGSSFTFIACANPTSGGSIAADQTICAGFVPAAFTSSAAATGNTGTLEYKWQLSTTSSSSGFADIASSNSATYPPGALTSTTWYKRLARVTCMADWTGAVASNVLQITVNQPSFSPGAFTVANLQATGTGIKWYAAASGGTSLATSTALVNGTHYYASQTVNGVESTVRFDATASILSTPCAPTGSASQSHVTGATVASLQATGTNIRWYAAASGGAALATSTALVNGTHYYASQTVSCTESATRLDVTVAIGP